MFDANKLPESKYINGWDYDLDWDTYNDGKGLTESQAIAKKEYYAGKGYWCRAIKSNGRFMFYILAKDVPDQFQALHDYQTGKRKTLPKLSSEPTKKYRKPSTSKTGRSSATRR
jgi:hypothetical protein